MSEELDELKVLFPEEFTIKVAEKGGEEVIIKPFKFRKIFKVIDIIAGIAEQMASGGTEAEAVMKFLTQSEDRIFQILSLALNKPVEWFDDLEGDTGADIMVKVFQVNKSFFESKLLPLLQEMGLGVEKEEEQSTLPNVPQITEEEINQLLGEVPIDGQTQ